MTVSIFIHARGLISSAPSVIVLLSIQIAAVTATNMAAAETMGSSRGGSPAAAAGRTGLPEQFSALGATGCRQFIGNNGEYGEWGNVVKTGLETNQRYQAALLDDSSHAIANDPQMRAVCPSFGRLPREEKIRFWVWTFASIAWDESKCENLPSKRCTNGNCVGIMQMEEQKSKRYWRGAACNSQSMKDPSENIKCSLEIMSGQFEGVYGRPGGLQKSYWEKLRKSGTSDNIKSRMKLFPNCGSAGAA